MLLIQNGYMIDPKSGREGNLDILTDGGQIIKIGKGLKNPGEGCKVIDAEGLVIAPGLVDVHVHFREPGFTHKEDISTGAGAAAKGGFTTVVLMANTKPCVDNEETLEYVRSRAEQTKIHVLSCANVTLGMKGQELTDMDNLAKAGAVGFTDDGIPIMEEAVVKNAMAKAAELNLPISFHEENPKLIENNGINRGKASAHFGIGGSPREAEITLVERDLKIALETGACINIQHISAKESVELVRQAKKCGGNIHAEATPHHFTLTEDAAIKYGTLAKMNPPLREEADRLAIIAGLIDGTIDIIATDHAPHTEEEKNKPITEAPSGIIGLETALALGITVLVEGGHLTMKELLLKMSTNPAEMYHLDAGYLAEGGPAALVLIDPKEKAVVGSFASKASNSPFVGWELTGKVKMTVCNGKVVYQDGADR
ncbi:MAG: dihydroorotase [Bacteroidales bacterium]|nr:dihydroorotase [Lachnoclostridium sp.]MCM1383974.1 dihydroorotase [Lachnoclostridium sp.]MCM1464683.1 dihydroorotase [Bacteroidales bacterium]